MRTLLVSAVVAASLSTAAFAATTHSTTGAIKSYDAKTHSIVLSDGVRYVLPAKFKTDGLKPGVKVEVSWVEKGKMNDATAIKFMK